MNELMYFFQNSTDKEYAISTLIIAGVCALVYLIFALITINIK